MAKFIILYFMGVLFVWFVLSRFMIFAVPSLFDINLVTVQPNDFINYVVRLLIAFTFGFFYTNIKMKQDGQKEFSKRTIICNLISIIAIAIALLCDVSYQRFFEQKHEIYFSSLSKVWIAFPLQIISISILRKYGFGRQKVKWI